MARSDNWRINKSGVMAIEGAQVLKALQKVAGAAGLPKGFTVKFAAKGHVSGIDFKAKEVVIGAGRLFKEAPIPSDLFDVLVGLTLHEVGHHLIQTGNLEEKLQRVGAVTAINSQELDLFHKFANIGEDIVIESKIRANPNLAEYDEALHKWAIDQMRDAQPHKLLEVWIEYALGHKSTTILDLPPELDEAMHQLVALTGWLRKSPDNFIERAQAYIDYWATVKDTILNPPIPPTPEPEPTPDCPDIPPSNGNSEPGDDESEPEPEPKTEDKQPDSTDTDETDTKTTGDSEEEEPPDEVDAKGSGLQGKGEDDEAGSTTGGGEDGKADTEEEELDRPLTPKNEDEIDDELADAIENAIESDLEDITDQVAEEFGDQLGEFQSRLPVIRSRETKTPLVKPNIPLRKRLERIMTIRKRLQARIMHGEQYGKIDKRHLYRVATDKRIFSLRYKFPDGFPNTRILIDLTGSMSGDQADEVLEAAGALQTLVKAEVWCYNREKTVNLVRMDEGNRIHHFQPNGDTPSGLAIVGVAVGMKKNGLVIHLTDGEHNVGQSPWTATWILKKNGINLVNLIWGKSTKQYDYDGMNYKQIDGIAEFPDALYQILVEQVQLSKIGGK